MTVVSVIPVCADVANYEIGMALAKCCLACVHGYYVALHGMGVNDFRLITKCDNVRYCLNT